MLEVIDPKKIKKGVVFIMPCYECPMYAFCLGSEDPEGVIEDLARKLAIAIVAFEFGLEIESDYDEFVRRCEELIGFKVKRFVYVIDAKYCGVQLERSECKLLTLKKDGMAVILAEDSDKPVLLIDVNVIGYDNVITDALKLIAWGTRTELMETDPKDWRPIIEHRAKMLEDLARQIHERGGGYGGRRNKT